MQNVNVNKLKGKIVECGLSISDLADMIGINKSTMYRKLDANGESLLISEANAIVQALHLTSDEAMAIFFSQLVA
mgnify:CR=1 FL=1